MIHWYRRGLLTLSHTAMGKSSGKMGKPSGKMGKSEDPPTAPPVILRWQDLPEDDPDRYDIIISHEDRMADNDEGKAKRNVKENEQPKAKGKGKKEEAKGKGKKEEGAQLANYIKIADFAMACKMCPNTDWHPTFQCPNLTPELKEKLKEARQKGGTDRAFHPDDERCDICMSDKHFSFVCPWQIELPVDAVVGPDVDILCLCCGENRPHPGKPGLDWKARAVLSPTWRPPSRLPIKARPWEAAAASNDAATST